MLKDATIQSNSVQVEYQPAGHKFPIVGLGASAGGIDSFRQFFQHLPGTTGMAFIVVQHLDPTHESLLAEILSRSTPMKVLEIKNGMRVEANHVYVIPPNTVMIIRRGVLHLVPRATYARPMQGIDCFFQSLALEARGGAIGVLFSGNSNDGTEGLAAIKAAGGMTCCQDGQSAEFPHMPKSAIDADCVDVVLPPAKLAVNLEHLYEARKLPRLTEAPLRKTNVKEENAFQEILLQVREAARIDFSGYKATTIHRRLQRRMAMHHISSFAHYLRYLAKNPAETHAIVSDCLINVTGFFRDPAVFEVLRKHVFPKLVERLKGEPIRIWVPGCSTGEEPYSIAIALHAYLSQRGLVLPFTVFATDVSDFVISTARTGFYKDQSLQQVSAELRGRYFSKKDNGYLIGKVIRDSCIFARQDISQDPPFSRISFISCRNLLIYLDARLQKRIFPMLYYSLKPNGMLLLGSSESAGHFRHLFSVVDGKHKIFEKRDGSSDPGRARFAPTWVREPAVLPQHSSTQKEQWNVMGIEKDMDGFFLSRHAPRSILVNENLEVVQFLGPIKNFLRLSADSKSLNVLKVVHQALAAPLRRALRQAVRTHKRTSTAPLFFRTENQRTKVWIEVHPIPSSEDRPYFLITFQEGDRPRLSGGKHAKGGAPSGLMASSKLKSIIDAQGSANEELQAANEEIMSNNEELQSTNEELETAKEELQSTNEELSTVNSELQTRNQELDAVNNDLLNLLGGVNIPIVMMDCDLRIRRFTPMAESLLNLIPTDIGRPITDLHFNIEIKNLPALLRDVINNITTKEFPAADREGHWHTIRMRPYKTQDNRIEGVVLTITDSQSLKSVEDEVVTLKKRLEDLSRAPKKEI